MAAGTGSSTGVATIRPRTSIVVSAALGTHSTAPAVSAGTTPNGMKSPYSVIAWPPMLARLAVTETRVRTMSNHWNQVPSSPIGLRPMRRYCSASHIEARISSSASLAAAHRGPGHFGDVAPEIGFANGGVGSGDVGLACGLCGDGGGGEAISAPRTRQRVVGGMGIAATVTNGRAGNTSKPPIWPPNGAATSKRRLLPRWRQLVRGSDRLDRGITCRYRGATCGPKQPPDSPR